MTQPNRPRQQFQIGQRVVTPGDTQGKVIACTWIDGSWVYSLDFMPRTRLLRSYAEHELTEVGR